MRRFPTTVADTSRDTHVWFSQPHRARRPRPAALDGENPRRGRDGGGGGRPLRRVWRAERRARPLAHRGTAAQGDTGAGSIDLATPIAPAHAVAARQEAVTACVIREFEIACAYPERVATFWSRLLGWPLKEEPSGECCISSTGPTTYPRCPGMEVLTGQIECPGLGSCGPIVLQPNPLTNCARIRNRWIF